MRTTIDIERPILEELKRIGENTGGTLSEVVNALVAERLTRRRSEKMDPKVEWFSQPMRARVDLADKDAVYALADETDL